jgi:phosphatidylethanolamine/phosphatidyl-N-methylethanolamine N-methyltransferase
MRKYVADDVCMSEQSRRTDMPVPKDAPAAWTFFRQWLRNPRAMAAFSPSGRQLTNAMIAQLPADTRRVVELGAGTGVFTRAMLAQGIAAADLLVVELNDELCALLHRQFPDAKIVHGNACDLVDIATTAGFTADHGIDAAISGLGFLAMPRDVQKTILAAIFSVLGPARPLIQFTYGPSSPIASNLLEELGLSVRRAGVALLNLPPAFVFVYTREHR